jgi:hypothetical protein
MRDQLRQCKQLPLVPTLRPGLLGPPLGNEALAAGASDSLLLGWATDRRGDETRIDVEGRVEDGEAVGDRAELGEVAPHGSRIREEKGAVGAELRAEAKEGELRHEPLGPVDRSAGLLADRQLRWKRSLGQLTAAQQRRRRKPSLSQTSPQAHCGQYGRGKGGQSALVKAILFLIFSIKLAPTGGFERGREFSLAGSSG